MTTPLSISDSSFRDSLPPSLVHPLYQLPDPTMRLFKHVGTAQIRACASFAPDASSVSASGFDRELNLVEVMSNSVHGKEGWEPLALDRMTDMSAVFDAIDEEVNRVVPITEGKRTARVLTRDPTTGMRTDRKSCAHMLDVLVDIRATRYLTTGSLLAIWALNGVRKGAGRGTAMSMEASEVDDLVDRTADIDSKVWGQYFTPTDKLLTEPDAKRVSDTRATQTGFGTVLDDTLAHRTNLHNQCKAHTQFSERGWSTVLPYYAEPTSEDPSPESIRHHLLTDMKAGMSGQWTKKRSKASRLGRPGVAGP
jgi:hypothetical protein